MLLQLTVDDFVDIFVREKLSFGVSVQPCRQKPHVLCRNTEHASQRDCIEYCVNSEITSTTESDLDSMLTEGD